jgi:hypothetical protein
MSTRADEVAVLIAHYDLRPWRRQAGIDQRDPRDGLLGRFGPAVDERQNHSQPGYSAGAGMGRQHRFDVDELDVRCIGE